MESAAGGATSFIPTSSMFYIFLALYVLVVLGRCETNKDLLKQGFIISCADGCFDDKCEAVNSVEVSAE